jgi:hypothetical protein
MPSQLTGYRTYISIATFIIGMISSRYNLNLVSDDVSNFLSLTVEIVGAISALWYHSRTVKRLEDCSNKPDVLPPSAPYASGTSVTVGTGPGGESGTGNQSNG